MRELKVTLKPQERSLELLGKLQGDGVIFLKKNIAS